MLALVALLTVEMYESLTFCVIDEIKPFLVGLGLKTVFA